MRIDKLILIGIMAGIYSAILDGFEQDYGLNYIVSAFILTVLIIITGYIVHKIGRNEKVCMKSITMTGMFTAISKEYIAVR